MTESTHRPIVRRVVTSRPGGFSAAPYETLNLARHVGDDPVAVTRNRAHLAERLSLEVGSLSWMHQVHGDRLSVVGAVAQSQEPACDALVTATPGIALIVLVADCVPVLLADHRAGVIGAAHAGREGVRLGVVVRAVEAMVDLGASVVDIDVLLGPAICGGCYEVPGELMDQVESVAPGGAGRSRTGTTSLDLRAALSVQLDALGVTRVLCDPRCTAEDPALFSYRRDGVTGRQAGVIWLT